MVNLDDGGSPFFSIAVPTYNRQDLLRETLQSVLGQSFGDFEVIVGNDYQAGPLTSEMLQITDPRIRIVNHPRNLGEVGNMNALLDMAKGRYVTWLFDDDLYEPDFLRTGHEFLVKTRFPPVLFPSSRTMKVSETFSTRKLQVANAVEFTGRQFLRWYAPFKPQVASTFGLFDIAKLKNVVGRYEDLSPSAIGNYNDEYFLFKSALLDRIIFLNAPFYVFRRHPGSYSETNLDLANHLIAGREFIRRGAEVLRHPRLAEDFAENLMSVCKIHLVRFAHKAAKIEFARGSAGVCAVQRAISKHWQEVVETREQYVRQCGTSGARETFTFFGTTLYCQYIIIRLLVHLQTCSTKTARK